MIKYIKCPRCELNYIDSEKQEYCDVCLAEMKGNKLQFADEDFDDENTEFEEEEKTELCPICGVNYMLPGETMCESCKKKDEYDVEEEIDPEKDEEWKNYLDDDEDDDLTIDDETLEEMDEEEAQEEEETNNEPDEFEAEMESLDDLADDDLEDDDDDEDDDDLF
jgi:hypothetical protein